MIQYLSTPANALFVLIVIALFVIDYIIEFVLAMKHGKEKPSLFWAIISPLTVILIFELIVFLINHLKYPESFV